MAVSPTRFRLPTKLRGAEPYDNIMKIVTARFICSAQEPPQYPLTQNGEVAFAGRSNVGKSSAINTLLGRRNLVRTSKTPGLTRKLNFYLINEQFFFVDLPGYGFAKVPREVRESWQPMVENYLTQRKSLRGVILIADARHGLMESDRVLLEFLRFHDIPVILTATKADKLPKGKLLRQQRSIERSIDDEIPVVLFSSLEGMGKKNLWKEIRRLID